MTDPFDFDAFMARATQPDAETTRALQKEGVADAMDTTMGEVCPRLWRILIKEMQKSPKDNLHLNAVLNSALFAVLSFIASVTPKGETNGRENDAILIEKVQGSLQIALENGRGQGPQIVNMAHNAGELKLLQDANASLGKQLMANTLLLQAVANYLKAL